MKYDGINTWYESSSLTPIGSQASFGVSYLTYTIKRITLIENAVGKTFFSIKCVQRVTIPGLIEASSEVFPSYGGDNFGPYPIALFTTISPSVPNFKQSQTRQYRLVEYSPRTLSASVSLTHSDETGKQSSVSHQHTTGSSTSTVSSYNWPYPESWGASQKSHDSGFSASDARASSRSNNASANNGVSMSIKDWGCYSALDASGVNVNWAWGQEFPWNVLKYPGIAEMGSGSYTTGAVRLPPSAQSRLFIGWSADAADKSTIFVQPPSELAMCGVDLHSTCEWMMPFDSVNDQKPIFDTINRFQPLHTFQLFLGHHNFKQSSETFSVGITAATSATYSPAKALDLTMLALEELKPGAGNGALTGFLASRMTAGKLGEFQGSMNGKSGPFYGAFELVSAVNNLLCRGYGFTDTTNGVSSNFSYNNGGTLQNPLPVTINCYFIVTDMVSPLALTIKHWVSQAPGVKVSLSVNNVAVAEISVDDTEGTGGQKNSWSVSLRNKNVGAFDYNDFINPGLNVATLTITPSDTGKCPVYTLRALAIT